MRQGRPVVLFVCFLFLAPCLPAAAGPALDSGDVIRVAVLPFEGIAAREDDRFLTAGFAETLTTALARVHRLQVVERGQLGQILAELKLQHSGLVDQEKAARALREKLGLAPQ